MFSYEVVGNINFSCESRCDEGTSAFHGPRGAARKLLAIRDSESLICASRSSSTARLKVVPLHGGRLSLKNKSCGHGVFANKLRCQVKVGRILFISDVGERQKFNRRA